MRGLPDRVDPRVGHHCRAAIAGQREVRRACATDVEDSAVGLEQRLDVVRETKLRPSSAHPIGVQSLVADVVRIHRLLVTAQNADALTARRSQIQHAGALHESRARLCLDD